MNVNVVPLESVIPAIRIRKGTYFISQTGSIFSTVSNPRPVPICDFTVNPGRIAMATEMTGGRNKAGNLAYNLAVGSIGSGYRTSVERTWILSRLNLFPWPKLPQTALGEKIDQALTKPAKYWIIAKVSDDEHGFAGQPKRHITETSANQEAERLARLYPGTRFQVFESRGSVVASGVKWN